MAAASTSETCTPSMEKPCIKIDDIVSLNIRMHQCDLPYRLHRIDKGEVALWATVTSGKEGCPIPQEKDDDVPDGFLESRAIEDLCSLLSVHRCVTEVYVDSVDLDKEVASVVFSNMPWLKTFKLRDHVSMVTLPEARWDKLETAVFEVGSLQVLEDILPTLLRATERLDLQIAGNPAHGAVELPPFFRLRDAHAKNITLRTTMCVHDILEGNTRALRVTVKIPWLPLDCTEVWSRYTCVGALEVTLQVEKFRSYNRLMHFMQTLNAARRDVEFSLVLDGPPMVCERTAERGFRGMMYEEFVEMDRGGDLQWISEIRRVYSHFAWNSMTFVDEVCAGYTSMNIRLVHLSLDVATVEELLYFNINMDRTPLLARQMHGHMPEEVELMYLLCSESLVSISVDCSETSSPDELGRSFCHARAKYQVTQELTVTFSGKCVIHARERAAATLEPMHLGRNVQEVRFSGTGSQDCGGGGESIVFDVLMHFLLFPLSKVSTVHVEYVNDNRMQKRLFTALSKNFSVTSLTGRGIKVTHLYAAEEFVSMISSNMLISEVCGVELPTMSSQLLLAQVLGSDMNCTLFRFSPEHWTCEKLYRQLIKNRDVRTAVEAMITTDSLSVCPLRKRDSCISGVDAGAVEHVARTVVAFKNVLFKDNIATLSRKRKMTIGVFDGESATKAHMHRAAELYRQIVDDVAKNKRMRLDF